jgi:hypothetical protein
MTRRSTDFSAYTFETFAARHGLTLEAKNVPFRFPTRKADSQWDKSALHFAVTIYGAPEARTGARPVIWQGCYSVGAGYPVMWAQLEAKKAKGSRLGWLEGRRSLVSKLQQSPRAEPVDHAEARAAIVVRYRELAPLQIADVLESLQCDVSGTDDSTFEDWAGDYGYDADSRSALETFEACRETARAMRAGLGREAFRAFLDIQA